MDMVAILISLLSGVLGGNAAGKASPEHDLGPLGNTLVGLVGGTAAGYILTLLNLFGQAAAATGAVAVGAENTHGLNLPEILTNIASSGVGGALLTYIVAMIKNASNKA